MNGNRIIKAIYVAALGFGSLLPFSSCGNVKTDNGEAMADQLFEKSANVIKGYTDSLANVADSATLRRLKDGFNEKMSKINFQFPADTDLKLSEEENDSLIRLIDRHRRNDKGEGSSFGKRQHLQSIARRQHACQQLNTSISQREQLKFNSY